MIIPSARTDDGENGWPQALLFSFFYACTDEFHQIFVPERGPGFRDVLIDTCGALAGIGIYMLVSLIWRRFRK